MDRSPEGQPRDDSPRKPQASWSIRLPDHEPGPRIETFVLRVWLASGGRGEPGQIHGSVTHVGHGTQGGFHGSAELVAFVEARVTAAESG